LIKCINPNQPSSQIEETPEGYQIKMKCNLDHYAIKCLTPIVERYNLALLWESGLVIIS
jgi:hypothetical protein